MAKVPSKNAPNLADNEPPSGALTYAELMQYAEDRARRVEFDEEIARIQGWRTSPMGQIIGRQKEREARAFYALARMAKLVGEGSFGTFKRGSVDG
jgi:hypothetical protein